MFRVFKVKSLRFKVKGLKLKGLTLTELLISIMLISVMLGAIWAIYGTGSKVFSGQLSRYDMKDQASFAFITMTKELHQAVSITAATATSLTFTADINGDGAAETIQYIWSGAAGEPLERKVAGTQTTALVRSVDNPLPATNPLFSYSIANSLTLTTAPVVSQVQLVAIDLYTRRSSGSDSETFHLRTKIFLQTIETT